MLQYHKMEEKFANTIAGYIDSMLMIKSECPNLNGYSQPAIYQTFIGGGYNAHDSLEDCHILLQIMKK